MAKSRARYLAELLNASGLVQRSKSALAGEDSTVDLDALPTIPNSQLEHSSVSIAGHTLSLGGSLTLDTADIGEHESYLYYTNARARAAVSASGSLSYDSATGVFSYTTPTIIASLSNHSTDTLSEGSTNLYYTSARANTDFDTRLATKSTTNLAEGTNLYYTDARVASYLTSNSYATQSYVGTQIANLVDSAPATLDTLNELAAALGDDPNFATTVTNSIGTKWTQDNTKISNWDTAYGWGDHASAGYLTGNQTITLTGDVSGSGTTSISVTVADDSHAHDGRYYTEAEADSRFVNAAGDTVTGILNTQRDIRSAGQIRATGWYDDAASTDYTGLAFEIGVSSGIAYALSYNRDTTTYGPMGFQASSFAFNNSVTISGNTVWHQGNDGSGSGLDADLLDGYDSGSYLNRAGTTYYQAQNWIDFQASNGAGLYWSANTGAGWHIHPTTTGNMRLRSGESTYCQIELNTTGTARAHIYADNSNNAGWLNSSAAWRMRLPSSGSFIRYEGATTYTMWDSGNDGSGSGLDADLLDGQHGSYYQPASTAITTGNIGSQSVSSASNIDGISFRNGNSSNGIGPDYVQENGTGYITSVSLFGQTDGALYSQAYSTAWVHQIFGDYRTGNLAVRGRLNGTWQSWKTVWTSANDGSGSGLDADLLDGMQPGTGNSNIAYTDSTGNLKLFDPENYSGEVRLGAAWDRGGVYASNTLTLGTGSSTIDMVFSNVIKHTFNSSGDISNTGKINSGGLIDADNRQVMAVAHWSASGSSTGAVIIELPGNASSNYSMPVIEITTYEYNGNAGTTYTISGHNWQQASFWYNTRITVAGGSSKGVYLGYNSNTNRHCIQLGTAATGWDYGAVTVSVKHHPSYYDSAQTMGGAWNIFQTTNLSGINTGSGNEESVWHSRNDGSGSGLDADLLDGQHASTGATANTIVARDSGGDVYQRYGFAVHFNQSGGNSENPTIGQIWTNSTSDNYVRKSTPSHFRSQLGLWWSGNDGSGSGLDADLLDGVHAAYLNHRTYTDSGNYLGGHYVSGGTEKPNSSALGAGKLKPIMLSGGNVGVSGSWNDVLWMSTYAGGDVKLSTAIISSKYDATSVWVNKANFDSASWGTSYLFWNSGNDGSGSGLDADTCDGQHLGTGANVTHNQIYANDWFRTYGEAGLYSQSYGQHFYPDSGGQYWDMDGPLRVRDGYEGTVRGHYGYWDGGGTGVLDFSSWWLNNGGQNNGTVLCLGGSASTNAYSSSPGRKLLFGGADADALGNYYIGTNLENVGGNYTKLDLRWHTGIRMGAQTSYGGIRIFDSEDMGTLRWQFNGSSGYNFQYTWTHLSGHIGIYSSTNSFHLYPNDATYGSCRIDGSRNGYYGIHFGSNMTLMMNNTECGFHREGDGWYLYVSSKNLYIPGNITAYWSDRRLKKDIKPLAEGVGIETINALQPSSFAWNKKAEQINETLFDGKEEVSLIAQEVQEILPDAVCENKSAGKDKEYLTINYDKITPYLIQAVKDLTKKVQELEEKLNGTA